MGTHSFLSRVLPGGVELALAPDQPLVEALGALEVGQLRGHVHQHQRALGPPQQLRVQGMQVSAQQSVPKIPMKDTDIVWLKTT